MAMPINGRDAENLQPAILANVATRVTIQMDELRGFRAGLDHRYGTAMPSAAPSPATPQKRDHSRTSATVKGDGKLCNRDVRRASNQTNFDFFNIRLQDFHVVF
jgi:hypothetical protein